MSTIFKILAVVGAVAVAVAAFLAFKKHKELEDYDYEDLDDDFDDCCDCADCADVTDDVEADLDKVEDAVEDNHGTYAVLCPLVGEGVPAGCGNDFLDDERVKIKLDGIVGGSETGVVTVCRHQLIDGGLAHFAHSLFLQQLDVFAELRVIGEVAGYGTLPEHIAC